MRKSELNKTGIIASTCKKGVLAALCLGGSLFASAYTVEVDGIKYYYAYGSDKTAEVIANDNPYAGDMVIPSTIEFYNPSSQETDPQREKITLTVTRIGNNAFYGCLGLQSITLPSTIVSLGESAFEQCANLKEIKLPSSTTKIGKECFKESGLTTINLENVRIIGNEAFAGALDGDTLIPPKTWTTGDNPSYYSPTSSFSGSKIVGVDLTDVTEIPQQAFADCANLSEVKLGNLLAEIPQGAFQNCTALKDIVIPGSVLSIGASAFGDMELDNVRFEYGETPLSIRYSILKSVKNLYVDRQSSSLSNCEIENVTYGDSFETIPMGFSSCQIGTVNISAKITSLTDVIYTNCNIKDFSIPATVERLGQFSSGCTFENLTLESGDTPLSCKCTLYQDGYPHGPTYYIYITPFYATIKNFTMGNREIKATKNGMYANQYEDTTPNYIFGGADIESFRFVDGATTIQDYLLWMFRGSSDGTPGFTIEKLILPESMTNIPDNAIDPAVPFYSLTCLNPVPPVWNCGENHYYFGKSFNAKLAVPEGSVNAYREAETWKNYLNILNSVEDVVADNNPWQLYSLDGVLIEKGDASTRPSNHKGLFILKTGNKTQKLIIK